ncbi:MAG: cohesin domain-containing protein [Syntrophales bacterium]
MIKIRKISRLLTLLLVAFFLLGGQAVALDKSLTVGKVSGGINDTVAVPITINDAAGVGGVTFTMTYDPAVFTFMGLEQGGKIITKGDEFLPAPDPPAVYTTDQINLIKTDLFYQANDDGTLAVTPAPTGRVLVAAASADGLAGTNLVIFNAKFTIKGGNGEYAIGLLRTIIQNAAAGYSDPTFLPALVGTSVKNSDTGMYDTTTFPVYPATLVAGSITVNADKFNITGTATYGATNPAVGATAVLKRSTPSGYVNDSQMTVDSLGKYAFNGKLPGTYQVFITSNDPGFYNNQSAEFSVNANYPVPNIALSAPQRLTGSITLNGGYVAGLQVKVMDGSNKVVGVYPVNADGKFQTPPLPPGSYTLYAVYGNLTSDQITGDPLSLDWKPTLYSIGGTISGLTGDAAVMVSSVNGKLQKTILLTLPSGSPYSIGNLVPADDYIVSVTASGVPVTYYNGKTDVGQATPVVLNSTLGSKADANFDFTSITQGTISGTVQENSVNADIGVYAFETTNTALTQVNAVNGAYSFTLTPGSYEIFVIKTNGKIFYYNGVDATQNEAEAKIINLAGGGVESGNINIIECDNVLTGKVAYKSAGGDPAANVMVTATSTAGKGIGLTGQDGIYSIGGLCPGNYLVEMNPLDSKYAVQSVSVTVPTTTAVETFIINKGYVLSGTITDSANSSSKVANAMLYLLDQQTGALVNGRMYFSDSAGLYTIADIPDGIYTLNVAHALYRSYSEANLSITADNLAKDIQLVKGAYFNVTVTDGSNGDVALPGALVIVTRSGSLPVYALTDTNGNSKIYGLDATKSDYLILVQKSGYVRQVVKNGVSLTWSPADLGTAVPVSLLKPAALFDLSGKITTDSSGTPPVVGAYVLVSTVAKDFFATTLTDNSGNYSFAKLPQASDYRLVVVPGGGLRTQVQTDLNYTGSLTQINNVTISSGATISGTITRSGSAAIYVFLYTSGNKFVGYTKADNTTGAYSFTGIVPGTYKVLAVSSGFSPKWYNGATAIESADTVSAGGTADITL